MVLSIRLSTFGLPHDQDQHQVNVHHKLLVIY